MEKKDTTTQHFFATCAVGWAVAQTRDAAIAKLARFVGSDIIVRNRSARGGLYCWSCKVSAPESAHYEISQYMPQGVPVTEVEECLITTTKGAHVPAPAKAS